MFVNVCSSGMQFRHAIFDSTRLSHLHSDALPGPAQQVDTGAGPLRGPVPDITLLWPYPSVWTDIRHPGVSPASPSAAGCALASSFEAEYHIAPYYLHFSPNACDF